MVRRKYLDLRNTRMTLICECKASNSEVVQMIFYTKISIDNVVFLKNYNHKSLAMLLIIIPAHRKQKSSDKSYIARVISYNFTTQLLLHCTTTTTTLLDKCIIL